MNATEPKAPPAQSIALDMLRRHGARVEAFLRQALDERAEIPPRLREAIEYSLLAGGKRLRPALVLESFLACGTGEPRSRQVAKEPAKKNSEHSFASVFAPSRLRGSPEASALAAAAAIELIHTFSLIHDDLPAMDDDDLRRGRPTNHKVFGEALAILAGDAMVTLAFELLAEHAEGEKLASLVRELSQAAGPAGMIGGQVLDIAAEHQALELTELERLHRMKTGALIAASCRMGAIAAGADESQLASLTRFGAHLGLAFQIVDDVLDVTATTEQLGKVAGKDAGRGKNTYPRLLGLDGARERGQQELAAALSALSGVGPAASRLHTLARFVIDRKR